jgi:hypothetical protein
MDSTPSGIIPDEGDAGGPSIFGGRETVFDPNGFGNAGNRAGSGAGSDTGNSGGNSDSVGDTGTGTGTGNGPYGHGYFADGRARKRAPKGSRGASATPIFKGRTSRAGLPLEPHAVLFYLQAIHGIASAAIEQNVPFDQRVIPLAPDDGMRLATGVCNVARHYPMIEASQKWVDWGALIATAASVYGPMAILVMQRRPAAPRATMQQRPAQTRPQPQQPAQPPPEAFFMADPPDDD